MNHSIEKSVKVIVKKDIKLHLHDNSCCKLDSLARALVKNIGGGV